VFNTVQENIIRGGVEQTKSLSHKGNIKGLSVVEVG